MIFATIHSDFSSFLFTSGRISNKDECFKILFFALYKLTAEEYNIIDYKSVADSLKRDNNIFVTFTKSEKVNYNELNNATNNLYYI